MLWKDAIGEGVLEEEDGGDAEDEGRAVERVVKAFWGS